MNTPWAAATVALLVLAACSSDDGDPTGSVAFDDAGAAAVPEPGDAEPPEAPGDSAAPGDTAAPGDPAAPGDLVDLTRAVPGTWPVGDAGTVTFSIVAGSLVLDDVVAADGWRASVDEQDADEIEVDFRRGDVEWEIEIELVDGGTILEIEIDQDVENADTGGYEIGDAGTFAFDVQDGRLVLTDLNVADGWTLVERDEETDEIELELVDGPRAFDVDVELTDGAVTVEIDYAVVGPADG